jgi:signal transduction histidine kinase/ligand-binding sensor domain-containing protein
VEQGLPSDVVKATTQDSLGFFWIATDDGLVKYDGVRFTTYKNAFRSQFAKGFLHTREGQLYAFGDLDVVEIQNQVDTVIFKPVLKGQRYFSDSTLWFPKAMYQDFKGDVWIAEPRSVLRFKDNVMKRYDFGEQNRSPVFIRSFSFFEDDQHNLFAISYKGNVFRFDQTSDSFLPQADFQLPEEVSHVLFVNHQLLIAARRGLFIAQVKDNRIGPPDNIFPIRSVSNLLLAPDSSIFVSTYTEDLYRISVKDGFQWENLYYNFNGINSCYISHENDIWVSTDKGLVLVQRNLFTLTDINSQSQFVEGIAFDPGRNVIYYANKESLMEIAPRGQGEWERRVILEDKSNYFQALVYHKDKLWASSSWNVFMIQNDKIVRSWDFSKDGNFIHHVTIDSKDNVWLCQAGSKSISVIDKSLQIKRYAVEELNQNDINYMVEGRDGMYAVADGRSNFLFFKEHTSDTFANISPPIEFETRGDFTVGHLAVQGDILWLGSSEGLLRWDHKEIRRIDFGEDFGEYPVSCVEVMDDENILFSNSFGLFRYNVNSGEYWLYDENSGLPSNTITNHGIFLTDKKQIWIGTSYGLATATGSITETRQTRKPYCVEARVNGALKRFSNGLDAPYGSYITLQFSPISFPENKINLQYRFGDKDAWKPIERRQLSLSDLPSGVHHILVRAKKNTGLGWSEPTVLTLKVDTPYWKKIEFVFLITFLIILIAWASYAISSAIMNQRKQYLEDQINERTQELQKANEELTIRNTELDRFVYSASHDLSAPLKSILGLIIVAKLDEPGETHAQYLNMMERSVHKLEAFIEEVVTYSRNTRMPVKLEAFNFKEFVEGLLQDHEYSQNFKHIKFLIEDHLPGPIVSDLTRMKIILNNLLSNAIKFHWIDNCRDPYIRITARKEGGEYELRVQDNGRGIKDEHLSRIFEMFYRATDDAQGSGLGLYILKESVMKLGGTVQAVSAVEVGTTFIIRLPEKG